MTRGLRSVSIFIQSLLATRLRRMAAVTIVSVAAAVGTTALVWAAFESAAPARPELSAMLPQGALLTIETRDFAGLLKRWNDSPEKTAWLKSDNYSVFTRSRLLGRLTDAQQEFAQSAGLPPDMSFLDEVAGNESVFAWYDIGKLEFLYITRMPSGGADKTRLMQMRSKFSTRQVGNQTFYVRSQSDSSESGDNQEASPQGQSRTVAFATSGDWLLLATREDLMAGALTIIAANTTGQATNNPQTQNSLSKEPWFVDARTVATKDPGELRMTLNLDKIVPTPYFRSYWVQRNITEMKQYRSAVADLYLQSDSFREERVLVPKSAPEGVASTPDLGALVTLLPQDAGVYRAVARPSIDAAIASLNEKLIQRTAGEFTDTREAPMGDVSVTEAGSTTDLETRIDAAPLERPSKGIEFTPLRQTLAASDLQAMMTVSRTGTAMDGIWVSFQSAVVLVSAKDWDLPMMQSALQNAMQADLTASGLGLTWKTAKAKAGSYFEISETRPLEMAVRGKVCILTDDPNLMQEMLNQASDAASSSERNRRSLQDSETQPNDGSRLSQATFIAGVDLPPERASFARWSAIVDKTNRTFNDRSGVSDSNGEEPSFFSQNMRSLADTFSSLESERVLERQDGALTRQTVTYAWRH